MYALSASAAGVSLLVLAPSVEAKIVYTRAHHVVDRQHPVYMFDLDHDGTNDFKFSYTFQTFRNGSDFEARLTVGAMGFNDEVDVVHPQSRNSYLPLALKKGTPIGFSNFRLGGGGGTMVGQSSAGPSRPLVTWGYWYNVTNRYLGLAIYISGEEHYGWARLSVQGITATLTGYAYETVPNKPIIAGKTHGADVVTVGPATLGRLAVGRK